MDILAHGASTIDSIIASDSRIFKTTFGNIFLASGALTSLNAGIGLYTDTGSILTSGLGPHLVAAGDSELFAPLEAIGISLTSGINLFQVKVNGMLLVTLGATRIGLDSGHLSGTLPYPNNLPILFLVSYPKPLYPYGGVYFNGMKIWPVTMSNPLYLFYLAQAYNSLVSRFVLPAAARMPINLSTGHWALSGMTACCRCSKDSIRKRKNPIMRFKPGVFCFSIRVKKTNLNICLFFVANVL